MYLNDKIESIVVKHNGEDIIYISGAMIITSSTPEYETIVTYKDKSKASIKNGLSTYWKGANECI